MLRVLSDPDDGVLLKGTTPELAKRLKPVLSKFGMRWDRKHTQWFVPGSSGLDTDQAARKAEELHKAILEVGHEAQLGIRMELTFAQFIKAWRHR